MNNTPEIGSRVQAKEGLCLDYSPMTTSRFRIPPGTIGTVEEATPITSMEGGYRFFIAWQVPNGNKEIPTGILRHAARLNQIESVERRHIPVDIVRTILRHGYLHDLIHVLIDAECSEDRDSAWVEIYRRWYRNPLGIPLLILRCIAKNANEPYSSCADKMSLIHW